jgi:hypothetical protein
MIAFFSQVVLEKHTDKGKSVFFHLQTKKNAWVKNIMHIKFFLCKTPNLPKRRLKF